MAAGLTWWQAEQLARAGIPVRRASWMGEMFNLEESRGPLYHRWISYWDSLFYTTWEWIGAAPNTDSTLGFFGLSPLPPRHVVKEGEWHYLFVFGGSEMSMADFDADDWTDAYPDGPAAGVAAGTGTTPDDHGGTGVNPSTNPGGRTPDDPPDIRDVVDVGFGGGNPRGSGGGGGGDEPDDGGEGDPKPGGESKKPQPLPLPVIGTSSGAFSGVPSKSNKRLPGGGEGDASIGDVSYASTGLYLTTEYFPINTWPNHTEDREVASVGIGLNVAFVNKSDTAFSLAITGPSGRGVSLGVSLPHSGEKTYGAMNWVRLGHFVRASKAQGWLDDPFFNPERGIALKVWEEAMRNLASQATRGLKITATPIGNASSKYGRGNPLIYTL